MPIRVNNGGVWSNAAPRCKNGASWVTPQSVWANDGGTWKKVWPQDFTSGPTIPPVGWGGTAGNYLASMGVDFTGGEGPFTFLWDADDGVGGAYFDDPTIRYPVIHSTTGAVTFVNCAITDATGHETLVSRTISQV